MKTKELRKLNDDKLDKLLKDLKLEQMRASADWNIKESKMKEFKKKNYSPAGIKTSLKKDIRRTIAKILTIKKEREIIEYGN